MSDSTMSSMNLLHWAVSQAPVENSLERLVLIVLADHADGEERNAYPSMENLCTVTVHSPESVNRALRALIDRGLVRVQQGALPEPVMDIPEPDRPTVYEILRSESERPRS